MTDQFWWYMIRSSGVVAWGLSFAAILIGILMSGRVRRVGVGRLWFLDLHRFASSLTCLFLGLHLFSLWADDFAEFGLAELFVPFKSNIRTTGVAYGVGAFWLLVLVEASSLVRERLPKKVWHGIHFLSYPVFMMGTTHALIAGTDLNNRLLRALGFTAVLSVIAATAYRINQDNKRRTNRRRTNEKRALDRRESQSSPSGEAAGHHTPVKLVGKQF